MSGSGDYISREAAIAAVDNYNHVYFPRNKRKLEEIPAADVRPVRRGKWISHDFVDMGKGRYTGSVECSVCNRFLPVKENFCPNCGADMRGES